MLLSEALQILRGTLPETAKEFRVWVASGFTPLHLATLLEAELRVLLPGRAISIETGLFGDMDGNLRRLAGSDAHAGAVLLEWADLDQRLGTRSLGNCGPAGCEDILQSAAARVRVIQRALAGLRELPIAISLPSLPLPPLGVTSLWHGNSVKLRLRELMANLAVWITGQTALRLLDPQWLDLVSPPALRFDANADAVSAFPYTINHASVLAESLALVICGPRPKKGIITDLDDTLWSGIVGEVGAENVHWDLDHGCLEHGLYQKQLRVLAEEGVLLAVVSKNDPRMAAQALERPDLLLGTEQIWPVEAAWTPKSEGIARILEVWNIAADSVVFIDDSPMELAEVQAAQPDLECIRFPKGDLPAVHALVAQLRNLFGKNAITAEDGIRLASLRSAAHQGASVDGFLRDAQAVVTLSFRNPPETRVLELINKTNQFNLNGRRFTEGEWSEYLKTPGRVILLLDYRDKFGPLGKILVLGGVLAGTALKVDVWVMSCRAFSRRIEHRCLDHVFARFALESVRFEFVETPRNGPLQQFLAEVCGVAPGPGLVLSREIFRARCPELFSEVLESD